MKKVGRLRTYFDGENVLAFLTGIFVLSLNSASVTEAEGVRRTWLLKLGLRRLFPRLLIRPERLSHPVNLL